jgi:hypothetical protein
MWERLQHNDGQEIEELAGTARSGGPVKDFKFDRQSSAQLMPLKIKRKNTANSGQARQYNEGLTLMDLVEIFTDEAGKMCKNKTVANLIALELLKDYIKKHVGNIKIVS